MALRSRTEGPPAKKPPFRKSSFSFILLAGITIFAVIRFGPGEKKQETDIPRSDLQMFDEGAWSYIYRAIAHYSDVKKTGFHLESNRVRIGETLAFCDESRKFLEECREAITKLAGEEERGGIPEYTQAALAFLEAVNGTTDILETESSKIAELAGSNYKADFGDFVEQINVCNTQLDAFREMRAAFLTPTGLSERQLQEKIDTMDSMIRSAK